jgi:uncharacterized flavoprotein (TIGR03862 family)
LGVRFALRHDWCGFEAGALQFRHADQTLLVTPHAVVLALGGASWPRLGADGGWVGTLEACGVAVSPLRPANSGFVVPWSAYFRERFAGVPLKSVALTHGGITRAGEVMITENGMEGGVVYALSCALREAIAAHGTTTLQLDLRPAMSMAALTQKLSIPRGALSFSNYVRKAGFSSVVTALLREIMPAETFANVSPNMLAQQLKALPITLTATAGLARAISTAGGIRRDAMNAHGMLHAMPGVFVAGEMLDWEAPTGGYLLQGCFSTAVTAARGVVDFLNNKDE